MMMIEIGSSTSQLYNIGFEIFPDLAGYVLFFLAMRKLKPYAKGFGLAKPVCYPLMALGSVKFIAQLLSLTAKYTGLSFGESFEGVIANVLGACEYFKFAILMLFCLFVFCGIMSLSKEVGLPKISKFALAAVIYNLVYFTVRFSSYVFPFTDAQKVFLYYVYTLMWFLLLMISIILVFQCYMYICYEGEEEIVVPESKITSFIKRHKK